MSSRANILILWALSASLLGWALTPLAQSVRPPQSTSPAERSDLSSLATGLGQGISLAALGGYRNIAANLVWIELYRDWQRRRAPEVLEKMSLAVALNPDSEFFWIDGARIIANDMPVWEVGDDKADSLFDTQAGGEVRRDYGRRALAFLRKAPPEFSRDPEMLVEQGLIWWKKLDNLGRAADFFLRAASQENAPYYISRVYAELLHKNGQTEEAYQYLKRHYETLPDDDIRAMKPFVARRIEELGSEL